MPHSTPARILRLAGAVALATGAIHAEAGQQVLKGELLIEGINANNYTDGNDNENDRASQMWLRASYGAKLSFDDFSEVHLGVVYDAEGGDWSGTAANAGETRGEVAINDAYVVLKQFLREDMHLRIGRQPVSWNLRADYGAFLFDSRANKPVVTNWDGVRGYWQTDRVKWSAFWYLLDEDREAQGLGTGAGGNSKDNSLYGLSFDWEPDSNGDNRIFLTGSASIEENTPLGIAGGNLAGEQLINYYFGAEVEFDQGFTFYGEFSAQDGKFDDTQDFDGLGFSLGIDWEAGDGQDTIIGVQYDWLSGDDNPGDNKFESFHANWEGVSDTLIMEHERYGELSELLVGNLEAVKVKLEYGMFEDRMRVKLVGAWYSLNEADAFGDDDFGAEFDFVVNWQYTYHVNVGMFFGFFDPGDAYMNAASSVLGTNVNDDLIMLGGINVQTLF